MSYGIPYKGSKNTIAARIVDILPAAKCFVDLFAGGCAVTDAALFSGKWERFIVNDINPLPVRLFFDAVEGRYRDERRVFTREDFRALKDSDPYCAYCWSFGSNGQDYLWGADIGEVKVLASRMIMEEDWRRRYVLFRRLVSVLAEALAKEGDGRVGELQGLERLERLEGLEGLERLERLEGLSIDYREVELPDNATIYCDIPYRDSSKGYSMQGGGVRPRGVLRMGAGHRPPGVRLRVHNAGRLRPRMGGCQDLDLLGAEQRTAHGGEGVSAREVGG